MEHWITRMTIDTYEHEVPCSVTCTCGPDGTVLHGHGHTLTECANDLQDQFDQHVRSAMERITEEGKNGDTGRD